MAGSYLRLAGLVGVTLVLLQACRQAEPAGLSERDADPTETPATAPSAEFESGHILGLRCSYASKFLRETYGLPPGRGCVVLRIDANSGAERAGLQTGDKIVGLDGVPVTSGEQFTGLVEDFAGRGERDFVVQRGDEEITVHVTLGRRADPPEDDPYFYYLRARTNASEDDYAHVVEDYTKAIEAAPGFDLAYLYRGEAQLRTALILGGDLEAAIPDILTALQLDPELSEAHALLGRAVFWKQRDFAAGLAHITRSIELNDCGSHLEPWDLDCAEDLLARAEMYLHRLEPGDDRLAEADIRAVSDVWLYEPSLALTRFELAYVRGDDALARSHAEAFAEAPLLGPNSHLGDRQDYVRRVLEQSTAGLNYSTQWFYNTRLDEPVLDGWKEGIDDDAGYYADHPEEGYSTLVYQPRVPGSHHRTVSWELRRGEYRLLSQDAVNEVGDLFQIWMTARELLPAGTYELDLFVDGQQVVTMSATVPTH